MITRKELTRDKNLCKDKAAGCLIGLAVGDALGDLGRNDAYRQRYGIVTNLYGDAKSTDDTEFALLTARTLLDCDGNLTSEAVARSWKKYIIQEGGIHQRAGRPLIGAVENLKRGMLPPYSGMDNVLNNDDGAAMRIAPVGIVCAGQPDRAAALAEMESRISHDGDGVWAAQAVAASIAVAMVNGSVEEIIAAGRAQIPEDSWLGRAMAHAMNICDQAKSVREAWEPLHTQLWTPEHAAAPEAIPQIYALFRLADGDFREGMFWAGNFGRDADTIAAIVGALAGAKQGISAIPENWVGVVRKPSAVCLKFTANEDIIEQAEELVTLIR